MTRLRSLDVFRGITVAAMVIVNNPGDWGTVYAPLLHADWNGWTPTDLIFPFFLFIVGVSIALSRRVATPWTIIRRGTIIWGLGLVLAGFPFFQLSTLRIPGVLARIAWCYVAAALLVRLVAADPPPRWALWRTSRTRYRAIGTVTAILLVGYWVLLTAVPFPGGVAGDLTAAGNIGAWLDRTLLRGHLWKSDWDPEGVLSTMPAIGTTLLGVIAGWWLNDEPSPRRMVRGLLLWGLAGVIAGVAFGLWLPINKSLWTSSYVLFTAGLASCALAVCYWICDAADTVMGRVATEPFVALGRNAILLFVISGLLARTLIHVKWPDPSASLGRWIYVTAFLPLGPPHLASLLYAIANLALLSVLLAFLHRRKIYLSV